MTLTVGTGPFGDHPAGNFNFSAPREGVLYLEDSPRWIRGRLDGETIVDSRRAKLLHESLRLPVFYFPDADVRAEALRPSGRTEDQPPKGTAVFLSLTRGDRVEEDAAWRFADGPLAGLIAFRFDALDDWLEEDEPLYGHARDPYHRIDVRRTSRHVLVRVDGEVAAETRRARVLFETGLPPRWYIPQEDVRVDLLEPSDTQTVCAYKGFASYWHVRAGGSLHDDLVWTYRDPFTDALEVKDLLAFFNERVEVEVDGEPQARPRTQWSRDG